MPIRRRLPPEVRELHGRVHRKARPPPPPPVAGALTCPASLSAEARAAWHTAAAAMTAMRTLGAECGPLLERYATGLARWREAEAMVAEMGAVIPAPRTGVLMSNPWLSIARQEADRLLKMEAEMGLTPAARGRVSKAAPPETPEADSPWDRIIALQAKGAMPNRS